MKQEMTLKEIGEKLIELDESHRLSGALTVHQAVREDPRWRGETDINYFGSGVFEITFSICNK